MPVLAWAVPKALLGVRESRGGERGLRGGLGWDLAVGGTPPNLLPDSSVTTAESTVLGDGDGSGAGTGSFRGALAPEHGAGGRGTEPRLPEGRVPSSQVGGSL